MISIIKIIWFCLYLYYFSIGHIISIIFSLYGVYMGGTQDNLTMNGEALTNNGRLNQMFFWHFFLFMKCYVHLVYAEVMVLTWKVCDIVIELVKTQLLKFWKKTYRRSIKIKMLNTMSPLYCHNNQYFSLKSPFIEFFNNSKNSQTRISDPKCFV